MLYFGVPKRRGMGSCLFAIFSLTFTMLSVFNGLILVNSVVKADECQTFPETGFTVCGNFLTYWRSQGGVVQQGYPLSQVFWEQNALPPAGDGQIHLVQYFQRARFENHPHNAPPYDVLLGLLGSEQYKMKYSTPSPTNSNISGPCQFFRETGFSVCGRFLDYWNTHGGLAEQGYPLSQVFIEQNAPSPAGDGRTHAVQYFQRARFENHPENAPPYDVLLGLLGAEQFKSKYVVIAAQDRAALADFDKRLKSLNVRADITLKVEGVLNQLRNLAQSIGNKLNMPLQIIEALLPYHKRQDIETELGKLSCIIGTNLVRLSCGLTFVLDIYAQQLKTVDANLKASTLALDNLPPAGAITRTQVVSTIANLEALRADFDLIVTNAERLRTELLSWISDNKLIPGPVKAVLKAILSGAINLYEIPTKNWLTQIDSSLSLLKRVGGI